jgi:hypothetical protein
VVALPIGHDLDQQAALARRLADIARRKAELAKEEAEVAEQMAVRAETMARVPQPSEHVSEPDADSQAPLPVSPAEPTPSIPSDEPHRAEPEAPVEAVPSTDDQAKCDDEKIINKKILVKQSEEKVEVVPAVYRETQKRVLVAEASEKIEVIPAELAWVEERVEVEPASSRTVVVPAVYETVLQPVVEQPAQEVMVMRADGSLAKEHRSATYRLVEKRVIKTAQTTKMIEIPAKYKLIRKQIVKKPAEQRRVVIPAKYTSVTVRELITPERVVRVRTEPEYAWVARPSHSDTKSCKAKERAGLISHVLPKENLRNVGKFKEIDQLNANNLSFSIEKQDYLPIKTPECAGRSLTLSSLSARLGVLPCPAFANLPQHQVASSKP